MSYAVVFWTVAGMCVWKALEHGGLAWLLCWPGLSFALAGAAYAGIGPRVFGKQADGTLAIVNVALLLPYLLYTWAVWHLWRLSSREAPFHELCDGITVGRRLLGREMPHRITAVFDLTSEFNEPRPIRSRTTYRYVPALDGRAPDVRVLQQAAAAIAAHTGDVYIHCANGRGRTGTLAAAVLLMSGQVKTPAEAIAFIQSRRPSVALKGVQMEALTKLATLVKEDTARLERAHEVLEHSSDGPIVRFTFRGVHDSTHGGQMDTYMKTVVADTKAAGMVVDLSGYEYEFGNDVFALFLAGYDPVAQAQRPLCVVAQGKTRASLAGLLQASNLPGFEGTFVTSTDEALHTLTAKLAAARRARVAQYLALSKATLERPIKPDELEAALLSAVGVGDVAALFEKAKASSLTLGGEVIVPELGGEATLDRGQIRFVEYPDPVQPVVRRMLDLRDDPQALLDFLTGSVEGKKLLASTGGLHAHLYQMTTKGPTVEQRRVLDRILAGAVAIHFKTWTATPEVQRAMIEKTDWRGRYVGFWHLHPPVRTSAGLVPGFEPSMEDMQIAIEKGQLLTLVFRPDGFDAYDLEPLARAGQPDLGKARVIRYRSPDWTRRFAVRRADRP